MEKRIHFWLDRITFPQLFFCWIVIITGFGLAFYYTHQQQVILIGQRGITILDAVYFSFVTAATIGYGDITPIGIGRLFAVIEGILGLLMYGLVISKLVSYKQETMLEQIYTISSEQKISEIRNALYLFRTDLARVTKKISRNQKRFVDFRVIFTALDAILIDVNKILRKDNDLAKKSGNDQLHLELMLHSVVISLNRLADFLTFLKKKKIAWINEMTRENVRSIRESLGKIIDRCRSIKSLHGLEKVQMIGQSYLKLKEYVEKATRKQLHPRNRS